MSSSTPIFTALFWARAGTLSRTQDNNAAKAAFPYFIVSTLSFIVGAILAHCWERATAWRNLFSWWTKTRAGLLSGAMAATVRPVVNKESW